MSVHCLYSTRLRVSVVNAIPRHRGWVGNYDIDTVIAYAWLDCVAYDV